MACWRIGRPFTGRALSNAFSARWHGRESDLPHRSEDERRPYQAAVAAGDFATGVIFAGEAVDLVNDVPPAAAIVARLATEAEQALRSAMQRVI